MTDFKFDDFGKDLGLDLSAYVPIPETLFYHNGLDAIHLRAQSSNPNASENYFKISDQDIRELLNPEIVAVQSSTIPSNISSSQLASVQRTLASRPTYIRQEVSAPAFVENTESMVVRMAVEMIFDRPGAALALNNAGIKHRLAELIDLGNKGKGIDFMTDDRSAHAEFENDLFMRHLDRLAILGRKDKVSNREIAEGYFPQPDYLDGRYIQSQSQYAFGVINAEDLFAQIPESFFDKSRSVAILSTGAFLLLRVEECICVIPVRNHQGEIDQRLLGRPPSTEEKLTYAIFGEMKTFGKEKTAKEKVSDLLDYYRFAKVEFITHLELEEKPEERFDVVDAAHILLSAKKPAYIKGSDSSGGRLIARLGFDEQGNPYIETSSREVNDTIESSISKAEDKIERLKRFQNVDKYAYPESLREKEEEKLLRWVEYSKISVESLLIELLAEIKNPIIEKEIPYETFNGARVEFRMICQTTDTSDIPQVVAHYCKESTDPIAANISISGRGALSDRVMSGLVQHRAAQMEFNNGEQPDFAELTKQYMAEITASVNTFAAHYYEERGLKSFAVDLVPVWNEDTKKLEFWLLEVQDTFGFAGLIEVDPEAAKKVEARLEQLKAEKQRDDTILLPFSLFG